MQNNYLRGGFIIIFILNYLIMKKGRIISTLIVIFIILSAVMEAYSQDHHLEKARRAIETFRIAASLAHLDTVLMTNPQSVEANYMKAEILLLSGNRGYKRYITTLEQMKASEELTVLRIKEAILIGDHKAPSLLEKGLAEYPGSDELRYVEWLTDIDKNGFFDRAGEAQKHSNAIIVKPLPFLALYGYSRDIDPGMALRYLDTLDAMSVTTFQSKDRPLLELLTGLPKASGIVGETEVEYTDCGPGMGIYMTDTKGNKIKMEMDTGSGSSLFTIHNDSTGSALEGEYLLTIADGIWYNYMEKPADMHYKIADFSNPSIRNVVSGHFAGSLTKADGCFSPFSLGKCAITFDPIDKRAWLRDSIALEIYLSGLNDYTQTEYIDRNGWIYIPCKVNGKEVLMMVETGSRDVNLNMISAPLLDVEPYQGTIQWRGADYPTTMVDFMLEVGDIEYEVKSGLVSDFVLGNKYTGLASAGDIGPDFFRNYIFTIDPYRKRLIIERPRQ